MFVCLKENSSHWHNLGNFQILQNNSKLKKHYQYFLRCAFRKLLSELWESDFPLSLMTFKQTPSTDKSGEYFFFSNELLMESPSMRLSNAIQHTAEVTVSWCYVTHTVTQCQQTPDPLKHTFCKHLFMHPNIYSSFMNARKVHPQHPTSNMDSWSSKY